MNIRAKFTIVVTNVVKNLQKTFHFGFKPFIDENWIFLRKSTFVIVTKTNEFRFFIIFEPTLAGFLVKYLTQMGTFLR